jgi:hypothetical protein
MDDNYNQPDILKELKKIDYLLSEKLTIEIEKEFKFKPA